MRQTIKVLNIIKRGPNQLIVEYRAKTEKPLSELIADAADKLGVTQEVAKQNWLNGDDEQMIHLRNSDGEICGYLDVIGEEEDN